jgi:predicted nucleic acid-binding Zn ribbon protein
MRKTRGMAPASGAVEGFFQDQELALALRPHLAKVHWEGVVGPQVAGVTQVEAVKSGVLYVRVKNSVWANELTLLKDDMVRRLNAKLGGRVLTDIHFKASGLAKLKKQPEPRPSAAPTDAELAKIILTKAATARMEANLVGITDDALRGRIREVMLRAARTEEWKRRQGWPVCGRCGALSEPVPVPDPTPLCTVCRAVVFGL